MLTSRLCFIKIDVLRYDFSSTYSFSGRCARVAGCSCDGSGPPRAAAQAAACQPVFDALDKVMSVPTHLYSTLDQGDGKEARHIESIYAGGTIYQKEKSGWEKMKVTTLEAANQERENRRKNKPACEFVKEENVDGKPANLYVVRTQTYTDTTTSSVWIARTKATLVKQEIEHRRRNSGKMHYTVKYEYENVEAPKL